MKYILILVVLFSFSYSDEIQRIELIVKDITNLREKYEASQEELNYKILNEIKQNKKILSLENQIKDYLNQLKIKDNKIKNTKLKKKEKVSRPVKVKPRIIYRTQKLENPNKFPKLILKKKYIKYKKIKIKAKTYTLTRKADIYDATYGNKVTTWSKGRTFTSNEKAISYKQDSWVRITGYFRKNSLVVAKTKMWVKAKYIK